MQKLDSGTVKSLLSQINEIFDQEFYLRVNDDVSASGMDAQSHFILSGMTEGRAPSQTQSAQTVTKLIVTRLGRIPGRDDLEQLYRAHLASKNLRQRVRANFSSAKLLITGLMGKFGSGNANKGQSPRAHAIDNCDLITINALSSASEPFASKADAVEYLFEHGYKSLDALNYHLVPNLDFHRNLYAIPSHIEDHEVYQEWLSVGFPLGKYISEAHLLHAVGSRATQIAHAFDHRSYIENYVDVPHHWGPEQALEHFLTNGIAEGRFKLEINYEITAVIEEVIEAMERSDPARALASAEKAVFSGIKSDRLKVLLARHYVNLNHIVAAKNILHKQESTIPIQSFWLNYYRAEIFKRGDHPELAIDHMSQAVEYEKDSVWVEQEHQRLLKTNFERGCNLAKRRLDLGDVDCARRQLDTTIKDTYDQLYQYGLSSADEPAVPPSYDRPLRIGILADNFLPQCKLYRVDQKVEQLNHAGLEATVFDFRSDSLEALHNVGNFDLWIIYRVPALFDTMKVVHAANKMGRPTFYEIDDLLFDPEHFPEPISAYGGNLSEDQYAGLLLSTSYVGGLAKLCKYGIASTPALAGELSKYVQSGEAIVHRNALSSPHIRAIAETPSSEKNDDCVRIFYGSGTRAHKDFFADVFLSALERVMEQHPNTEFHTFGYVNSTRLLQKFPNRIHQAEPEWDIAKYWAALGQADINVAVLKKSLLTDSKSEIKWLEAGMLGVPSIVSGTSTMDEVINEGEDGLIANTKNEWVAQLTALCTSPDLRMKIGVNAKRRIISEYSLDRMSDNLNTKLHELLEKNIVNH